MYITFEVLFWGAGTTYACSAHITAPNRLIYFQLAVIYLFSMSKYNTDSRCLLPAVITNI